MISALRRRGASVAAAVGLLLVPASQAVWAQANVIANIKVEGCVSVSPDGVLAKISAEEEGRKPLKVGDPFDPDSPEDQAKLEDARRAVMGLTFFESVRTSVERGDEGVTLTFSVVEKKRVQRVTFVGNTSFTDDQLLDQIASRPGQIIDPATLRRDAQKIQDFYSANRRMTGLVQPSVDDYGVVTFVINEAVVEDIVVEGLKKTKPKIVQRQIKTKPGDVYDEEAIRKDVLAIYNLGWFEEPAAGELPVQYRQGVKDPERGIIIVIPLKERRTGTATAGVAYSSMDNVIGVVSYQENNLRGRGERLTGTIQFGGRQSYEVGFFEPFVDRAGTSFEVNVFDTERRRQFLPGGSYSTANRDYDERRKGFNLTVTRPMAETLKLSFRVRQEQISDPFFQVTRTLAPGIGSVGLSQGRSTYIGKEDRTPSVPLNPNLNPDIAEPGETLLPLIVPAPLADEDLSSVTFGALFDTRDLIANPSRGQFASLFLEQAGILGGNSTFTKASVDARQYFRMPNSDHTIALRLMFGTTIGDVPLVESYSVGGSYALRGYREDRFRGDKMAVFMAEYRVPISKTLTGVAFFDGGDAWSGSFPTKVPGFVIPAEHDEFTLNIGVGVGARIDVGPFGKMRLDIGRGSEGTEVHLSFGQTF
jgi:outer membrane protein insertion porin family